MVKSKFFKSTPQSEPASDDQVENNAGGYSFEVDKWKRLDRFLILGSEGGTYYVSERDITKQSSRCVLECLEADPERTIDRAVEISDEGRSHTNDPAVFVLASALKLADDPQTRRLAKEAVQDVCRIPTHLFRLAEFVDTFGGWGTLTKEAFADWYNDSPPGRLSYHLIKYQSRGEWSNRDLLRLSHPNPPTEAHDRMYAWVVNQGWDVMPEEPPHEQLGQIWAFEVIKRLPNEDFEPPGVEPRDVSGTNLDARTVGQALTLIDEYDLPRSCIPGRLKNEPVVWETMLDNDMPMHALRRNLPKMTEIGVLTGTSKWMPEVVDRLTNREALKGSRTHPLDMLKASKTYSSGSGYRSDKSWNPVPQIKDALDEGFREAFGSVEPTGKRVLVALDVSSSMTRRNCAGIHQLTCREASGALALLWANVESRYEIVGFTSDTTASSGMGFGTNNDGISPLDISANQRLDDVLSYLRSIPFGGTDCALPLQWANRHNREFDAVVILTDSETWRGNKHPHEALQDYRSDMGLNTRFVVVGMEGNDFTVADPDDDGSMDVVGFDSSTPQIISEFVRGEL